MQWRVNFILLICICSGDDTHRNAALFVVYLWGVWCFGFIYGAFGRVS